MRSAFNLRYLRNLRPWAREELEPRIAQIDADGTLIVGWLTGLSTQVYSDLRDLLGNSNQSARISDICAISGFVIRRHQSTP
jgi:hypothetical protein